MIASGGEDDFDAGGLHAGDGAAVVVADDARIAVDECPVDVDGCQAEFSGSGHVATSDAAKGRRGTMIKVREGCLSNKSGRHKWPCKGEEKL